MNKILRNNKAWKTIELRYSKKPTNDILAKLHQSAFKWAPTKKHWFAKKTAKNEAFVKSLGSSVQTKLAF